MADEDSRLLRALELAMAGDDGDDAALYRQMRRVVGAAARAGDAVAIVAVLHSIERLVEAGRAPLALRLADQVLDRIERFAELLPRARDVHLAACRVARPDPMLLAAALFDRAAASDTFIEAGTIYAEVLGDAGRAEYRRLAESAWRRIKPLRPDMRRAAPALVHDRRIVAILDHLAMAEGDLDRRIALRAKLLGTPEDYLGLIDLCRAHGRPEEARRWAEEGMWQFEHQPDPRLLRRAKELG